MITRWEALCKDPLILEAPGIVDIIPHFWLALEVRRRESVGKVRQITEKRGQAGLPAPQ